jgi:hypothetical protein
MVCFLDTGPIPLILSLFSNRSYFSPHCLLAIEATSVCWLVGTIRLGGLDPFSGFLTHLAQALVNTVVYEKGGQRAGYSSRPSAG